MKSKRQKANIKRQKDAFRPFGRNDRNFLLPYDFCLLPFAFLKTFLAFSLAILLAPAAAAQPKRAPVKKGVSPQFAELSSRAAAARDANRLDEAISLYLQALKTNPKWGEGWWYLGSMFYERDQYREARDAFQNLAIVDPKFPPGWTMLGLCEFKLREYGPALEHLRHGNAFGFGDNEELRRVARYHETILLNRSENYELAYDTLQRFIDKKSESREVIMALGLTMLRLPYLPEEVPAAKREIVFRTGSAAYLALSERLPDAERAYTELLRTSPNEPGVQYAYGIFLMRSNPDAGLEAFKRELQNSPNHVAARLQIAFEYIKRNEHAAGLPYAEEAARLAPALFATHNALGRILVETGDTERAIRELEIGVKQAPDSPEMYFALVRAYSRAGRTADAAKARAEFMRLDKIRRGARDGSNTVP